MFDPDFFVTFFYSMMSAGTVYLLASLGEIYAERSGVLNLGVEGMMIMGALGAFLTSYLTEDLTLAIMVAALSGLALSLIHAFLSITLKVNQYVSGIAVTIFGLGLSGFLGRQIIGQTAPRLQALHIPLLADIPFLGPILFRHDILVYTSLILSFIMWFILFRTKPGLNIRSIGENPSMADALGVNVFYTRYACVMIGGILAGLSGAFLSLSYTPLWIEGMTRGRGWIVIALVILATWNPLRALLGAYLFGGVDALQFRLQALGFGTGFPQLLAMLPYASTIIVLTLLSFESLRKRIGVPSALGIPYGREE